MKSLKEFIQEGFGMRSTAKSHGRNMARKVVGTGYRMSKSVLKKALLARSRRKQRKADRKKSY